MPKITVAIPIPPIIWRTILRILLSTERRVLATRYRERHAATWLEVVVKVVISTQNG